MKITALWLTANGYAVVEVSPMLQANCLTQQIHQSLQFHPSVNTQFFVKQKVYRY